MVKNLIALNKDATTLEHAVSTKKLTVTTLEHTISMKAHASTLKVTMRQYYKNIC